MVAAAVIGAGVIGAVGSGIAGSEQAKGQEQAANTQTGMFNTITKQQQPFIQGGYGAENELTNLLGTSGNTSAPNYGSLTSSFTPQDYLNNQDPGYQFQLQTGAQATRNADTPGVGSLSGAALKDLMSFNQNMASTGYQNAFNRFTTQQNNTFARLSGLAGLGQNAASNTGTAGTQLGTGIAQAQAAAAGSQAGGIVGATNSLGGSAGSLAYLLGNNSGNSAGSDLASVNNPNSTNLNFNTGGSFSGGT
jgi:hypothetical protein